jgi:Flp pilus assembly CpaF family ATPase
MEKHFTPEPTHRMTDEELEALVSTLPGHAEELDTASTSLPESLKSSAEYFLSLLEDESVTYIVLDHPRSIVAKRNGKYFRDDTSINFIDSENYRFFIDHFIRPLTNAPEGDDKFLFEGFLSIPDPLGASLPPLVARIHALLPPVVDEPVITIAKRPRNK